MGELLKSLFIRNNNKSTSKKVVGNLRKKMPGKLGENIRRQRELLQQLGIEQY